MSKYLRVTMPDGSKWDVPAGKIAHERAKYYAEHDTGTKEGSRFEAVYHEEYQYSYRSDFEIKDWAANNMNWSDVSALAVRVQPISGEVHYQVGWVNGDKEIVEKSPCTEPTP